MISSLLFKVFIKSCMKKFNILSVTPFFPPEIGGISYMVLNLNNNLIKQGHDVTVIAPKHIGESISKPQEYSSEVYRINSIYLPGWPYSTLTSISFPIDFGLKIKSIMKKGNFDIVHVHAQHFPITWFAINAAHKLNLPCVLTSHGMWALNPKVMGGKTRIEDYFNKFVYTKLLKKTNVVIGLTNEIRDFAKQLGDKDKKYFTISNGANTAIYKDNLKRKKEFRNEYHLSQESKMVLFRGRFEEVKGIIEFVKAAKNIVKNKQIEVIIVGGGTLQNKVESTLKGIERIHLFSWQPVQDIHKLNIASDIFVLPSKFEGVPLIMIEAMNAGLHIVYTPVGGIPEFIEGYSRKTLLKNGSSEEIQNALNEIIPHFSSTRGMDESLNYARKFDWENLTQETTKVYSECLNQ